MPNKNNKGFTLLELITVVAIIGVLAAIAIPQFNSYRDKTEKATVVSDCRTLYRGFILYYLEWNEFPLTVDEAADPADGFKLNTLSPITNPTEVGGANLGINVPRFMANINGGQAEIYDSPDPTDQTFFLVFPWKKDPNVKFIVAQSADVEYADGTPVDLGNWLDGVFVSEGGNIIQ